MRSRVEHLRDIAPDDGHHSEHERRLGLLRECSFLEELSRCCIARFLGTPELWPHFRDETTLANFWRPENATLRRQTWGSPFDVKSLRDRFDAGQVTNGDLSPRCKLPRQEATRGLDGGPIWPEASTRAGETRPEIPRRGRSAFTAKRRSGDVASLEIEDLSQDDEKGRRIGKPDERRRPDPAHDHARGTPMVQPASGARARGGCEPSEARGRFGRAGSARRTGQ
jgi:hypothetical protein